MNSSKVWLAWEEDFANRPVPVLYYGAVPSSSTNGKESIRVRLKVVDVSHIERGADGEVSLSAAAKLYPLKDGSSGAIIKEKEIAVVRPVSGFLSANGKFFDTEGEAEFYDAAYNLNNIATGAVGTMDVPNEDFAKYLSDQLIAFIQQYENDIYEYITARRNLDREASARDKKPAELDGQSTGDNPVDDPRVRGEDTVRVGDETSAQDNTERAGAEDKRKEDG